MKERSKPVIRRPLKIGSIFIWPPLVLAPMAGVTDAVFRAISAEYGAGLVATEMVSVEGLRRGKPSTWRLCLQNTSLEVPLAVQIFGSNPQVMAEVSKKIEDSGASIIDINAGCPVKKVTKQGAGANLMREPHLLATIVEKVRQAVTIPVSVKMRIGWNQRSINVVDVARLVADAGADTITVHARTAVQHYRGAADWEWIRKTKAAVDIPVIGNGDVTTPSAALKMFKETNCDGVMIGRASIGNPWIFYRTAREFGYAPQRSFPQDWNDFLQVIRSHLEKVAEYESNSINSSKRLLIWYSKGIPGSSGLRRSLSKMDRPNEMMKAFTCWIEDVAARGFSFKAAKAPSFAEEESARST